MARGIGGEETYTPEVQPEVYQRRVTPYMQPSDLGPAIERVGDALDQKYQADSATWAGDQVANFRVQAINTLEDMKAKAPAGDPGNFTENYLAAYDKQAAQLADTAGSNPYASRMLQKGLGELRDTLTMHSMEWEAQQRVAYQTSSIQDNLNKQLPLVRAHPEISDQVGSTLMDQINASRNDPATKLQLARRMDSQLRLSAAMGLVDRNPADVYQQLSGGDAPTDPTLGRLNDPASRSQVLDAAASGIVDNAATRILEQYRTGGQQTGVQALGQIDNDSSIPAGLRDDVRKRVNAGLGQLREDARGQSTAALVRLHEDIAKGTVGPGDRASAWSLYHSNAFDPGQLAGTLAEIDRAETNQASNEVALETARDAYLNRTPLDPKDKDAQAAVDMLFSGMTRGVSPGSAEYGGRAAEIAARTGVVPPSVVSWARATLTSGDPRTAAQAADVIARIGEANPRAEVFADDPKTTAMADAITTAVRAGADPGVAVTQARSDASIGKGGRELLDAQWKKLLQIGPQSGALVRRLNQIPSFSSGNVPNAMQAQFDTLTREYFDTNGGKLPEARDRAVRDLQRVWGVSEVNGNREIMAYAPEAMYPGLTVPMIREDIAHTVANSPELTGVDASKVRLVEAPGITDRTQGSRWYLSAPDQHGLTDILRGPDGSPLQYRLPVTKVDFDAVRQRMGQAAIAKARQLEADRALQLRVLQEGADEEGLR